MKLYTDADGVFAVYEREAYIVPPEGGIPLFLQNGIHYFSTLQPDMRIINAYERLQKQYGIDIHIVTNVMDTDPLLKQEHTLDKIQWVQTYMPFINTDTNMSVITIPKYEAVQQIQKRPLNGLDILISDFNNDLIPWTLAGGYGIKYINGLNDPDSFTGANIPEDMSTGMIIETILDIIEQQSNTAP